MARHSPESRNQHLVWSSGLLAHSRTQGNPDQDWYDHAGEQGQDNFSDSPSDSLYPFHLGTSLSTFFFDPFS